jgi:outer membrane protein
MRFVVVAFLAVLATAAAVRPAAAQDRLAYVNVESILALMPETKALAQSIDSLGRSLAKGLEVKEAYAQQKVEAARKAQAGGATEVELEKYRTELRGLEDEIRKGAEDADEKLARRRGEALQPLLEKLERTIKEVAKAEGYSMVLNSVDGDGNSIVLYGEEGRDISEKVLAKLGIAVPKAGAPKAGAPKTDAPKIEAPKTEAKPGASKGGK